MSIMLPGGKLGTMPYCPGCNWGHDNPGEGARVTWYVRRPNLHAVPDYVSTSCSLVYRRVPYSAPATDITTDETRRTRTRHESMPQVLALEKVPVSTFCRVDLVKLEIRLAEATVGKPGITFTSTYVEKNLGQAAKETFTPTTEKHAARNSYGWNSSKTEVTDMQEGEEGLTDETAKDEASDKRKTTRAWVGGAYRVWHCSQCHEGPYGGWQICCQLCGHTLCLSLIHI